MKSSIDQLSPIVVEEEAANTPRLRQKNVWRAIASILLLLAIIGPWWFDKIYMPTQYPCKGTIVRLEGNYCGVPMSGIWVPVFVGARFIELAKGISAGEIALTESVSMIARAGLYLVFVLFLLLPLVSPWFLILKGDRKQLRWIEMLSLGIAACICGIWVIGSLTPQKSIALWGPWLYISVATGALFLEGWVLIIGRRVEKSQPSRAGNHPET